MRQGTKDKRAGGRADQQRAPSGFDWRGQPSEVGPVLHHRARLSANSSRANQEALARGEIRARLDFPSQS